MRNWMIYISQYCHVQTIFQKAYLTYIR